MEEYAREPCPYRIVDDCGGAFAMGCIGGGVFQAIKGFRNAPSGFNRRLVSKQTSNITVDLQQKHHNSCAKCEENECSNWLLLFVYL